MNRSRQGQRERKRETEKLSGKGEHHGYGERQTVKEKKRDGRTRKKKRFAEKLMKCN